MPAGSFGGSQAISEAVSHLSGQFQEPIVTVLPVCPNPAPLKIRGRSRTRKTAPPRDELLWTRGVYRVSLPWKP